MKLSAAAAGKNYNYTRISVHVVGIQLSVKVFIFLAASRTISVIKLTRFQHLIKIRKQLTFAHVEHC